MKAAIRQRALDLGFDDCRFTTVDPPASTERFESWLAVGRQGEMTYLERTADKRLNPQLVLPGARSVICLAASYSEGRDPGSKAESQVSEAPRSPSSMPHGLIARYARFADYHDVLAKPLKALMEFANQLGGTGTRSLWYVDTGPVLEREFAQRAGVGFIGKHTNLIGRGLGNWILLAELLTTLKLDPDSPEQNRCGSCTRCLAACPTRAITAPFQLDARLCISYLTIELKGSIPLELRCAVGHRIFGCDDCLEACPWNRFAREGALMKQHARMDLTTHSLIELLGLDEAGFKSRFAGTPMLRAKRRGLIRNACVALGNTGGETALPALQRIAGGNDPLLTEHAQWALQQIQRRMAGSS